MGWPDGPAYLLDAGPLRWRKSLSFRIPDGPRWSQMVPDGPRVRLGWLEYVRIINMFFNVSTSINMYSINMSLEYQGPPMSFVQV